jgi:hypothetical protein
VAQPHEAVGLVIRERAKRDAAYHGEDRGAGADPEGEGEHGERGERRCSAKRPQGQSHVTHRIEHLLGKPDTRGSPRG